MIGGELAVARIPPASRTPRPRRVLKGRPNGLREGISVRIVVVWEGEADVMNGSSAAGTWQAKVPSESPGTRADAS